MVIMKITYFVTCTNILSYKLDTLLYIYIYLTLCIVRKGVGYLYWPNLKITHYDDICDA